MKKQGSINPDINFPILTIYNDVVSISQSEQIFTKWTKSVSKDKTYYENLNIYDSKGIQYNIKSVKISGYTNIFQGFDIFLNQSVYVNIELEKKRTFELSEFKLIALDIIKFNIDYYSSAGIDKSMIIESINRSSTFIEVFYSITGEYKA